MHIVVNRDKHKLHGQIYTEQEVQSKWYLTLLSVSHAAYSPIANGNNKGFSRQHFPVSHILPENQLLTSNADKQSRTIKTHFLRALEHIGVLSVILKMIISC